MQEGQFWTCLITWSFSEMRSQLALQRACQSHQSPYVYTTRFHQFSPYGHVQDVKSCFPFILAKSGKLTFMAVSGHLKKQDWLSVGQADLEDAFGAFYVWTFLPWCVCEFGDLVHWWIWWIWCTVARESAAATATASHSGTVTVFLYFCCWFVLLSLCSHICVLASVYIILYWEYYPNSFCTCCLCVFGVFVKLV